MMLSGYLTIPISKHLKMTLSDNLDVGNLISDPMGGLTYKCGVGFTYQK